ncbi:MAG TPA: membrane dipeptidase, partial [Steroidobacteraceae bacterium]
MTLRSNLRVLAGTLLVSAAIAGGAAQHSDLDARAQELHKKILNLDAHADVLIPSTPDRYWGPGRTSRTDVPRLTQGGVDVVTLAIAVGPGPRTPEGVAGARREADEKLATIRKFVADNAGRVEIALSASDIERIYRQGKIAVVQSFLNARSLGKDLEGIDEFHAAGLRVFGLTHAGNNDFADSSRPQE